MPTHTFRSYSPSNDRVYRIRPANRSSTASHLRNSSKATTFYNRTYSKTIFTKFYTKSIYLIYKDDPLINSPCNIFEILFQFYFNFSYNIFYHVLFAPSTTPWFSISWYPLTFMFYGLWFRYPVILKRRLIYP